MYQNDTITRSRSDSAAYNQALRSYMIAVYNYMAGALVVTGIVAYAVSTQPAIMKVLFGSPLMYVVIFAPVVMVWFFHSITAKLSLSGARTFFFVYSAAMGLSLSTIFLVYTQESIAQVFFITASLFGTMSLWGYTTKKDLSAWGSLLFMGVMGIFITSLANLFIFKSSGVSLAISYIGVLLFVALTAYDTQMIRRMFSEGDSVDMMGRKALMGALHLYINFINLFIMLLRIMGSRND
jgi:FtsH-binding integral membrane protein